MYNVYIKKNHKNMIFFFNYSLNWLCGDVFLRNGLRLLVKRSVGVVIPKILTLNDYYQLRYFTIK